MGKTLLAVVLAAGVVASVAPAATAAVTAPTSELSYYARIVKTTPARTSPSSDADVAGVVHTSAPWNQQPMQLLVTDTATDADGHNWLKVLLAKKPNGSYGWIPADYAQTGANKWRILVDVSSRRITIFKSGKSVRSSKVVVGARATPTPIGNFAIREVVKQPNPDDFSGPWIFHLNANSQKLKSFDGSDAVIGIHGRSGASLLDPLGSARSHGCVRAPNAIVKFMARHVVAGTPVEVRR
jgi:lipoprotein-anchoring transpeptidase ErfK/SrfK